MIESHPHLQMYPDAEQNPDRAYEMAHSVPEGARLSSKALHDQIANAAEFTTTDAGFKRLSDYLDDAAKLIQEDDTKGLELAELRERYMDADNLTNASWTQGKGPFRGRYPTDKGNIHGRIDEIRDMPYAYVQGLRSDMTSEEVDALKHEIIDPFLATLPAGAEVQGREVADLDRRIQEREQEAATKYDQSNS